METCHRFLRARCLDVRLNLLTFEDSKTFSAEIFRGSRICFTFMEGAVLLVGARGVHVCRPAGPSRLLLHIFELLCGRMFSVAAAEGMGGRRGADGRRGVLDEGLRRKTLLRGSAAGLKSLNVFTLRTVQRF